MPHEGASGEHKVRPCRVQVLIHKEILLLPAKVREHSVYLRVKEAADRHSSV